jgi:hypothetical protein
MCCMIATSMTATGREKSSTSAAAARISRSDPGLADNRVGRLIGTLLRNGLIPIGEVEFAPLDDTTNRTGRQLLCGTAGPYN